MRVLGYIFICVVIGIFWVASFRDQGGKRTSSTQTTATAEKSAALAPKLDLPQLVVTNWSCHSEYSYMITEGQVENISGKSLENITVVASYYTASGDFVTSDSALVEYNPLLPGQRTPFKTITRGNPAIKGCNINFKHFWGGAIKFQDAKERKKEEAENKTADLQEAQKLLVKLGFEVGATDGIMGPRTKTALQQFAEKEGISFDGHVSRDLLDLLRIRTTKF
jgi:putative peptidoglycan binding protein